MPESDCVWDVGHGRSVCIGFWVIVLLQSRRVDKSTAVRNLIGYVAVVEVPYRMQVIVYLASSWHLFMSMFCFGRMLFAEFGISLNQQHWFRGKVLFIVGR